MIELEGHSFASCDRISRRNALKIGFLGLGSLSLPELLRTRALAGKGGDTTPGDFGHLYRARRWAEPLRDLRSQA